MRNWDHVWWVFICHHPKSEQKQSCSVLGLVDNIEMTWLQSFGLGENFTQRSPISAETRGALHCRWSLQFFMQIQQNSWPQKIGCTHLLQGHLMAKNGVQPTLKIIGVVGQNCVFGWLPLCNSAAFSTWFGQTRGITLPNHRTFCYPSKNLVLKVNNLKT